MKAAGRCPQQVVVSGGGTVSRRSAFREVVFGGGGTRSRSNVKHRFPVLDPTAIDAFNWRAEQALRPAVVSRKVCGGNRSPQGAETQQILASVLRTAQQRQLNPHAVLVSLLRAATPIVPLALADRAR